MTLAQLILIALSISIFFSVFELGLHAELRDATFLFRRPKLLLRSVLAMNVLMVAFAVAIDTFFDLDPAIEIALVALAVSPVPPILPKQLTTGRSAPYAMGLLVGAVLLAIILVPASIELLGHYSGVDVHMPPAKNIPIVLISVILPVLAGIFVRQFAPTFAEQIANPVSRFATILLTIALVTIFITMSGQIWSLFGNGVIFVLALFTLVGLAIGHMLGGPDPDDRTVLALATCVRHPGVAVAIAGLNFPERKAEVMAVILCHLVVGAMVSIPYKTWRKRSHDAAMPRP